METRSTSARSARIGREVRGIDSERHEGDLRPALAEPLPERVRLAGAVRDDRVQPLVCASVVSGGLRRYASCKSRSGSPMAA